MDPGPSMTPIRRAFLHGEHGASVTGLVIKLAIFVLVAGLAVHEGGQVLRAQVKAQSAARNAATRASLMFTLTHNQARATAEATRVAHETDASAEVTDVEYAADGSATVTVADPARTLLTQHVSFLKGFTVQRATEHELAAR
jgi:Flp pilus assembly protein TadG